MSNFETNKVSLEIAIKENRIGNFLNLNIRVINFLTALRAKRRREEEERRKKRRKKKEKKRNGNQNQNFPFYTNRKCIQNRE